jgi:hypothetical protein
LLVEPLLADLVLTNCGEPLLLRLALGDLALLHGASLLELAGPLRGELSRLALALGGLALLLRRRALLAQLHLVLRLGLCAGLDRLQPLPMRGLGGAQALLLRHLARTEALLLRLVLGACLSLRSQLLVALGAQIDLGALLSGEARLVALLRLVSGRCLMLLGLASGRRLTLLGLASGHRLASGGLAFGRRLLALLRPLLVRLHPRFGAFVRLRTGIGGFHHHRRHHRGRHQKGDHVPFHRVDSFIPSSPTTWRLDRTTCVSLL